MNGINQLVKDMENADGIIKLFKFIVDEKKKMKELYGEDALPYTLAVDFDGTLFFSNYPDIGLPNKALITMCKILRNHGIKIILWTSREGDYLKQAVKACKEQGLEFDAINHSLPEWEDKFQFSRKIGAHRYIDDKAIVVTNNQYLY